MTAIENIKAALDSGFTVTLADNANYTVIKDSIGQYLIKYTGSPDNYIGLHGREGTQYEDQINMAGAWIVAGRIES